MSLGVSFDLGTKIFFGHFFWVASNKIDLFNFSNSATVYSMSSTPQKNTKSGGSYFKKKEQLKFFEIYIYIYGEYLF